MRHCSTQPCSFTCSHAYACFQQTKHSLPLASYQDTPFCCVSVFHGGLGKGVLCVFFFLLFKTSLLLLSFFYCVYVLWVLFEILLNVQIGSNIDEMLYILHIMNGTKMFTESCWFSSGIYKGNIIPVTEENTFINGIELEAGNMT